MKSVTVPLSLVVFCLAATTMKADPVSVLGAAETYSVLGASTVTNTGATVLAGDLGLYPGKSITGFPPGTVNGATHNRDAAAMTAQASALAAYTAFKALPTSSGGNLTGTDLGGLTLNPGVYTFNSSAQLTGTLDLNFGGLSNRIFVFQTGSSLTTASGSAVALLNEGTNDAIYWVIGSSATLGTTTAFQGTVIAHDSITLNTGATIGCGAAIALNAAVTLDTNTIGGSCAAGDETGTPAVSPSPAPTPEPGSLMLLGTGALSSIAMFRRRYHRAG